MIIVCIAGGSASGKTTLTAQLLKQLNEFWPHCSSITMDDYYNEIPDGIDVDKYKETTNFDDPSCLDLKLLQKHITDLNLGNLIDKPVFDFKTERRIKTEKMAPPGILLLDGTASLYFANNFLQNIQQIFKIYIKATPDSLLERRVQRDLAERGYEDKKSITEKDTDYVRPTFFKFIEPTEKYADLLISNDKTLDSNALLEHTIAWAEKSSEKIFELVYASGGTGLK